jgi:hypothetical protein
MSAILLSDPRPELGSLQQTLYADQKWERWNELPESQEEGKFPVREDRNKLSPIVNTGSSSRPFLR